MTLIYPIGIPAFFYWLLWRNKHKLNDPAVQLSLGLMYEAYQPNLWWFELFDMANKLFLTSIVIFFPLDWQMSVALAWSTLFILFLLVRPPYVREMDDRLHLFAMTAIYCLLLIGHTSDRDEKDTAMDVLLSVVLITAVIGLFLLFLYHVSLWWKKHVRQRQRAKLQKMDDLEWSSEEEEEEEGETDFPDEPAEPPEPEEDDGVPPEPSASPPEGHDFVMVQNEEDWR